MDLRYWEKLYYKDLNDQNRVWGLGVIVCTITRQTLYRRHYNSNRSVLGRMAIWRRILGWFLVQGIDSLGFGQVYCWHGCCSEKRSLFTCCSAVKPLNPIHRKV